MKKPFLYKHKNGYWYVYYFPDGIHRIKKTTGSKNKNDAIDFYKDFIDKKKYLNKHILLSEFKEIFFETSSNKNDGTKNNYNATVKAFLKFTTDKSLEHYSVLEFDRFFNQRKNATSVHTADRDRRNFNSLFNQAVKYRYLEKNIIPETIKFKTPEPDIIFYTKKQFNELLDAVDRELYKDIYTFAVLTGMRMSEIIHLKSSHVDLTNGIINVISDKSHKTKGGKSRQVELNLSLIPLIEKYNSGKYLFTGTRDGDLLNRRFLGKITKAYCRKAGLPDHNFKAFRSTFGKWLLDEGVNLKYISQQLGHASIETTEKHYAKYIIQDKKGWVNKISININ